jgi:hypothetical protein
MIKLIQIIEELKPPAPEKIYNVEPEDDKFSNLSAKQKKELIAKGSMLVPLPQDPNRPQTTGSDVITISKVKDIKNQISKFKKEIDLFKYSDNEKVQLLANEIVDYLAYTTRLVAALDKQLEIEKKAK